MALSFCSSLSSLQHNNNPDQLINYPQTLTDIATDQLLGCNDNYLPFSDALINPFYEIDDVLFYSDTYNNLFPFFSSPSDSIMSLSPETFPLEEFESYQCPKRQKSYANHYQCSNFEPNFFDGYVENSSNPVPEFLPEIPAQEPKFQIPMSFNVRRSDQNVKKAGGVSLSAQSIAARERRRKITEKTQELGKLIPGGNKMNTAEMFHAASKYVKFLQAQVGILELMGSIQKTEKRKEAVHSKELQALLTSPTIQERLYSEEKCLVPREFVQTIANDHEIQSKSFMIGEIDQLLRTNG